MIYHKHKFIFVHVPKCGGTAIEKFFLEKENISLNWRVRAPLNHLPAEHKKEYMLHQGTHFSLGKFPKDWREEYFSFSFVRNPWSKMVSCYKYFAHTPKDISFEEYIIRFGNQEEYYTHKNPFKRVHFSEQYKFVKGCNFIGRFENLQDDFNKACEHINIKAEQLPKENISKNRTHYTEYYNTKTKDIVFNKYEKDIKLFKYEFES